MPTVDLSQLPQPKIIEEPDFEVVLDEVKALMVSAFPQEKQAAVAAALNMESEPLNIIAQVMSYRIVLLHQRINDAAAACMLSHASGSDLDNLAANNDTYRLVIQEATDTTEAVYESDDALRSRAQRSFDGLSVAGPSGAYEFFAMRASGKVADARATSPAPAEVVVTILSTEGNGEADEELIGAVERELSAEDRRPVADRLSVRSAEIVPYQISASLWIYPGPESEPILSAASASLNVWLHDTFRIGRDITRSAIMAALHVRGVQRVELVEPAADVVIDNTQASWCTDVDISVGGTDE